MFWIDYHAKPRSGRAGYPPGPTFLQAMQMNIVRANLIGIGQMGERAQHPYVFLPGWEGSSFERSCVATCGIHNQVGLPLK